MSRLPPALFKGLFLAGLLGFSAATTASPGGVPNAGIAQDVNVDALIVNIEALAREFSDACEAREAIRTTGPRADQAAAIHGRMVTAVERLRITAADADHRTARRILERFNDAAFSFARNYLSPGEEVIEAAGPEARRALRRYREAVSRMKGNLFSWNPDLDALLADLLVVTTTVEAWVSDPSDTLKAVPVAGL